MDRFSRVVVTMDRSTRVVVNMDRFTRVVFTMDRVTRVVVTMDRFFGLTVSTTLCLHSHQILATERPTNWSSALLKDGHLNLLLQSKKVVKRG